MSAPRFLLLPILCAAALVPASAVAKSDDDVERAGKCTGGSDAKIKAGPDDGRLEVEFEVDQNRNGIRWKVRIRRNGTRVVATRATTRGPSGSFEIERKLDDSAGSDRFHARAKSPSGEVCTAKVTV